MPQPKSSPAEVSIYAVTAIMKVSPNWTRFEANMNRAFQTAGGSTTFESDTRAAIPGNRPAYRLRGNQWDYLGRWPSELHDSLAVVEERGATVGGISAGAVSLGEGAFDARYGTVTSDDALAAPMRRELSRRSRGGTGGGRGTG